MPLVVGLRLTGLPFSWVAREPTRSIYGPLSVIQEEADRMAGTLEEERLDATIRNQKEMPMDAAAVESAIRSNLKAHRSTKGSRQQLLGRYTAELKPWFSKQLVARAGRVGDNAFAARIDALLTQSKRLTTSLNDRIARQLDRLLPDIRKRVAADQLREAFGALPSTIETLTPESIETVWASGCCDAVKTLGAAWQSLQAAGLILAPTGKDRS